MATLVNEKDAFLVDVRSEKEFDAGSAAHAVNIPLENILVVTDDLALPFGTLRLKGKGSDAGPNGLKNIQDKLNTQAYARLRFGISSDFEKGRQVDYVIGKWTDEETLKLPERINIFADACLSFVFNGLTNTMNAFNGK